MSARIVASSGAAVLVFLSLTGRGTPLFVEVLAALTGAVTFFVLNAALVSTVIALADRIPVPRVLFDSLGLEVMMWAANVSVGLLAGLAGSVETWALPFALVPAVALHLTFRGHLRTRRDHEQTDSLLRAAIRVHSSVDPAQVRGALAAAAAEMLRCRASRIGREPPGRDELGAQLPLGIAGGEWLVVGNRRGVEPFEPADRASLDALAAVGASALSNAALFDRIDLERRKLEESTGKLGEAEAKYRSLVEQIPAVTYIDVIDPSDPKKVRESYMSPQIETVMGYAPEEVTADPDFWDELLHPEDRERALANDAHHYATGEPLDQEYRVIARDGRVVWVRDLATMVRTADGSKFSQGVIFDVSEQKGAEAEIRELNADLERRVAERTAQLEAASSAKSRFLSRMSHELRTPLNAILGFGQLLEMDELDDGQGESVRHILNAGQHLLDLINEILDISRIEAGKVVLSIEAVDVREVLQEALDLLGPAASKRDVRFMVDAVGLGDRRALADRQRLRQVLLNVISNGIKYGPAGGRLGIVCSMVPDACFRVSVTDEGPGIPPEDLDRLFTPFERLDADHGDVEGTGLGLSLSKQLVEAMGGALTVESEPGRGSTFSIDLPLHRMTVEHGVPLSGVRG